MKKYIAIAVVCLTITGIRASLAGNGPAGKAALGKLLFFDPILSKDRTISCASCHIPAFGFADTSIVSLGVRKQKGVRNTPAVMNTARQPFFFWDGRAKTLEEQALMPIENPVEMNLPVATAVKRLAQSKTYSAWFAKVFNGVPTPGRLAEAIAAFEQTLETSESAFDRWKFNDDSNAVSDAVKRGFVLFSKKGKCTQCHFGADFTQNQFRNIGLFNGRELNDSGRMVISGNPEDIGKFKTPGLRNIAITAPYMHNGMFNSLEEVIEFYNDPGKRVPNAINRDTVLLRPLGLTAVEKKDLEAFLLSLTDKQFLPVKKTSSDAHRRSSTR